MEKIYRLYEDWEEDWVIGDEEIGGQSCLNIIPQCPVHITFVLPLETLDDQ